MQNPTVSGPDGRHCPAAELSQEEGHAVKRISAPALCRLSTCLLGAGDRPASGCPLLNDGAGESVPADNSHWPRLFGSLAQVEDWQGCLVSCPGDSLTRWVPWRARLCTVLCGACGVEAHVASLATRGGVSEALSGTVQWESKMKCWILHNRSATGPQADVYEIDRFRETAQAEGIELEVFTPEQFDLIVSRDDRKSVRIDGETVSLPDFLLPRMGASAGYFALAVIRHLERLGVRSFNRSSAIEAVKDKLYTQQVLAASDLPFAKTMLVRFPVDTDLVQNVIGFPAVVKTISGSRGVGVFLSRSRSEFTDLMGLVNAVQGSASSLIIQELVESSMGRDLRVITIGGRAIACMIRTAPPDSFKANFSAGGSAAAYEMTPEIEWLAVEASRIFDLDVAGVDLLFDNDHFKISEVNSAPGFKGMEQSQHVDMARAIFDFVRVRLGLSSDLRESD